MTDSYDENHEHDSASEALYWLAPEQRFQPVPLFRKRHYHLLGYFLASICSKPAKRSINFFLYLLLCI